jgi:DNA/RNA endonuclease YhcR with UshA esterase domain
VGSDGTRYPSLGDASPDPALGSGRLEAGTSITGNVAFIRERKVAITEIVLTDGDGTDLVVIERPAAP